MVGLLALQGAYRAHGRICENLGLKTREIRASDDYPECTHLIIPGGESTTNLKLFEYIDHTNELRKAASEGVPILATCAGLILLAQNVNGTGQRTTGLLDISVHRNAYGRQAESFETALSIPALGIEPFPGIFIRAPIIDSVGDKVEILCKYRGTPVLVRQGNIIGSAFHPELSDDSRLHEYFLGL